MHNIHTNFRKFHEICKDFFENELHASGNFNSIMTDLQIVALSLSMDT